MTNCCTIFANNCNKLSNILDVMCVPFQFDLLIVSVQEQKEVWPHEAFKMLFCTGIDGDTDWSRICLL